MSEGENEPSPTAVELVGNHRIAVRRDSTVDTVELIGKDGRATPYARHGD